MVSERGLAVLRVIVQDYVASREPVGSKSIVDRHAFGVSAATIRNDMALLEEEELIAAPHTSSGRVPTDKGYRVFVDQLADLRPLSSAQRRAIETFLERSSDLDDVLVRTVRLLSQLTNQVAIAQYPEFGSARVRHVEVVSLAPGRVMTVLITDAGRVDQRVVEVSPQPDETDIAELRARLNAALVGRPLGESGELLRELLATEPPARTALATTVVDSLGQQVADTRRDRLVLAGAANLAKTEGDFRGTIFPVLEAIEQQVTLLRLFREMEIDEAGVAASIGRENAGVGAQETGLEETALLAGFYSAGGGASARLGLLGPTRMDYSNNMAAVRAVARYLSRLLGEN